MIFLYDFIVGLYRLAIGFASFFKPKAQKWITGRKKWRKSIKEELAGMKEKPIWMHVSSVGEYEQGQPILAELKKRWPQIPVVLTFFSPSGFELLSKNSGADYVFYLPLDGKKNARDFLNLVNPRAALFIKYEFWFHYFRELKSRNIFFALISANLRENQLFFKWYGMAYRKVLFFPNYFFVQDQTSKQLLNKIGQNQVEVTGDTRIDRVIQNSLNPEEIKEIESFCTVSRIIVLGSAWRTELKFIKDWIGNGIPEGWKIIIAPHEINEEKIEKLQLELPEKSVRYTQVGSSGIESGNKILILDTIGILKHVYQYGHIAIIGGGFYDGIHNILEPAVFGLPVLFGPKHQKFPEAKALLNVGGAYEINAYSDFESTINLLVSNDSMRKKSSIACRNFIELNSGAVDKVMTTLQKSIYVD